MSFKYLINMDNSQMIRGLSAVNYFVPDVTTAKKWYMELLGVLPHRESPDYVEFHIGASKHELALIDKKYEWKDVPASPSGAVVYWHTDDVEAFMEKLLTMGAKEHEPIRDFGGGYMAASVVDPFGNILGIMSNPQYHTLNPHPLVLLDFHESPMESVENG